MDRDFAQAKGRPRPRDTQGFLVKAELTEGASAHVNGLADKKARASVVDRTRDGALVHNRTGRLSSLRRKIEHYADPSKESEKTGLRRNALLVAPLESLHLATIADLSDGWLRTDVLDLGESVWVELWVGGGDLGSDPDRARARRALVEFFEQHDLPQQQLSSFAATEHDIYFAELTGAALMDLPVALPDVHRVTPPEKLIVPWLLDHQVDVGVAEVRDPPPDASTVALLDTGIAERHPLLRQAMLGGGVSVIPGELSAADAKGHGTRMAGLAAYENLADDLSNGRPVTPRCKLQNLKVMSGTGAPPTPDFMLDRTRDAVAEAEQVSALRRVFSLSIGAQTRSQSARTPWGVAVDRLAFDSGAGRLFCVAAGNEPIDQAPLPDDYPNANLSAGLTSPAEAVNAVTVGAMTDLQDLDNDQARRRPVAGAGELGPTSRCDIGGSRPIKPDVVAEGGNLSTDGSTCRADRAMQLLTTSHQHAFGPWLAAAAQTSAATATVAGTLAQIWQANPRRRPETIRGLLVHSARWTAAMRNQFPVRADLRRAVGYGAPRMASASWSENQRPTLILESVIHTEKVLPSKGREMHLVALPLPDEVLAQLGDASVELSVTLSYFVEPNENRVRRYQSAGLRWGIQRPLEDMDAFRKRINKLDRDQDEDYENNTDDLPWEIGFQARSRGTVQSDRARIGASELLGGRAIAVWSVSGWWRDRAVRQEMGLPYSLIVTIDAGDESVDLYTPILNEISLLSEVG